MEERGAQSSTGDFTLSVIDRLSTARTPRELTDLVVAAIRATFPGAEALVVVDPAASDGSVLGTLASRAWESGASVYAEGALAVVGGDGRRARMAVAVSPALEDRRFTTIVHIAGRLLPAVLASQNSHTSGETAHQSVLEQIHDLDRRTRLDGHCLAVGLVDIGVDPSLSHDDAGGERTRLRHRLRRILRPQDRVWELGDRLLVAQVLPEPHSALLIERVSQAISAVHTEAGASRRLVDAWVTARGGGQDSVGDLLNRAEQGLERMARLREAGERVLRGEPTEQAFAQITELSIIVVVDSRRVIRGANATAAAFFPEVPPTMIDGDAIDTDDLTFHQPDGSVLVDDDLPGHIAMKTGWSGQDRLLGVRYLDHELHWVLITAVGVADDAGRMIGYVAALTPVEVEDSVMEQRLRDAIDLVNHPLVVMAPMRDVEGAIVDFRVQHVNSAALSALHVPESDVVGAREAELNPSEQRLGLVLDYAGVIATRQAARKVVAIPDGRLMGSFEVTAEPYGEGVLVMARSLASSSRGDMAKMWDGLTGLSSRLGLLSRLDELQRSGRDPVTLIMCDIDDFTGVNDSLGRLRSDRYLVEVGRSLSQVAGPHDVVARVGSDEFAFLTTGAATDGAAQHLAERIRRTLREGVMVGERRLTAAASVGVAWAPAGGRPSDLLNIADLALYRSKAAGGDTVTMGRDRVSGSGPVEMESQLRAAVEQGQFVVHYQPIVELSDGRIRGVEALVRWQHPTRGLIYPGDFIPAAERRHLIADIGLVVLEQVCRQSRQWYDLLGEPVRISINVSTAQLVRPGLATAIADQAADAGIEPQWLQLEITESQLLSADESTLSHLWACRDVGCELAIDDFGTGHAGFDYLRRIPAHVLKIDKTFVDGLGLDPADKAIVAGVIAVGHGMGLTVVAEGVEKGEQAQTLLAAGCDAAQGWLWARALPTDEVLPLLRAGRVTP